MTLEGLLNLGIDAGTILVSIPALTALCYAYLAGRDDDEVVRLHNRLLEAKKDDTAEGKARVKRLENQIADKKLDASSKRLVDQIVANDWRMWTIFAGLGLLTVSSAIKIIGPLYRILH